jgi:histone deacetylase HOS2
LYLHNGTPRYTDIAQLKQIPAGLWYPSTHTQVPEVDPVQPRAAAMSGYSHNIVEEYMSPIDPPHFSGDFLAFKSMPDSEKVAAIRREAEDFGIEKPQGYNVSFHYNPHVEYHHFGSSHPMKPWRLTLTKQLVLSYGLEYSMDSYEPRPCTLDELAIFHDRQYLEFLSK